MLSEFCVPSAPCQENNTIAQSDIKNTIIKDLLEFVVEKTLVFLYPHKVHLQIIIIIIITKQLTFIGDYFFAIIAILFYEEYFNIDGPENAKVPHLSPFLATWLHHLSVFPTPN